MEFDLATGVVAVLVGSLLGAQTAAILASDITFASWLLSISAHAVFEVPGFLLAGAAGFLPLTSWDRCSIRSCFLAVLCLWLASIGLLVLGAVVESFNVLGL